MNNKFTKRIIRVLDEIDARIKYLENSPHRAFVLIEYDTILLFHWFNLYFNYYWDWFDHDSASQLFKYMEILKRFSEMCDRYEKMLREQYDYLKSKVNFENKFVDIFPPEIFSEESKENYTQYYQNYLGELYGGKLDTLYQISESTWEAFQIRYERLAHHTNYYELRCDLFYDWHAKALVNTYHCLEMLIFLIKGARSYPQTHTVFYMPSQEEIIKTLETEFCQYAKEKGMIVERDLQKTAQLLKPSRNELLDSKIWGTVMEREDDFYDLTISNLLEDNKEKRFEFIDKEKRKQLTENALLLKTIKSNAIDGELFDIRLSVETNNLISSLNADNLNLFYELILRRNIIQREMYPEKLKAKYEEWVNPSEKRHSTHETTISRLNPSKLNKTEPEAKLIHILSRNWFKECTTNADVYTKSWRSNYVRALIKKFDTQIAIGWEGKGKRNKQDLIKGHMLGALKNAGVIKGSNIDIARKALTIIVSPTKNEVKKIATYMGHPQGDKESEQNPYRDWTAEYVKYNQ